MGGGREHACTCVCCLGCMAALLTRGCQEGPAFSDLSTLQVSIGKPLSISPGFSNLDLKEDSPENCDCTFPRPSGHDSVGLSKAAEK